MKTLNFIFLITLLITGCKKDVEFQVYPCKNKIELGEFSLSNLAKTIPYDSIDGIPFIDLEGHGCLGITVNDPFWLDYKNPLQWNRKSSDCENSNNPNEYLYMAEEKFSHLWIRSEIELQGPIQVFSGVPNFLVRVTSSFKDEIDVFEKTGEVLEIYGTGADHNMWLGTMDQIDPFLSVSLFDDRKQVSDTNFGYEIHSSINLNGKTFSDVIVNTTPLVPEAHGGITYLYFSMKEGLVGMKDYHDNIWTARD